MSTLFATLLITHVVTGVVGGIATYRVLLLLLKKELSFSPLKSSAAVAYLGYFVSWLSVTYYYWFHYGANVKPVIKAGEYAWAHNVVMEAKEHVFYLLPTMAFVTALIVFFAQTRLASDPVFKSRLIFLTSVTLAIAVFVTLSGVVITGGAQ